MKRLAVINEFSVSVESVGAVVEAQSWKQNIPNFRRCDWEATSA